MLYDFLEFGYCVILKNVLLYMCNWEMRLRFYFSAASLAFTVTTSVVLVDPSPPVSF